MTRIGWQCAIFAIGLAAAPAHGGAAKTPVDRYGDPLPAGALFRLGTARFQLDRPVAALAVSPDGKRVAAVGGDRLAVWQCDGGQEVLRIKLEEPAIRLAFVSSPRCFCFVGNDALAVDHNTELRVYDVRTGKIAHTIAGATFAAGVSADGKVMTLLQEELDDKQPLNSGRRIARIDTATGMPIGQWSLKVARAAKGEPMPRSLGRWLSPDGAWLAAIDGTFTAATLSVYDTATGEVRQRWRLGDFLVQALAFSGDGKRIAAAHAVAGLRVWDVASGKKEGDVALDTVIDLSRAFQFTPDGAALLCCDRDEFGQRGVMAAWDWRTGERQRDHAGAHGPIALVPGGKRMAATGDRHTVHLVPLDGSPAAGEFERPGLSAVFSPDGRLLAWSDRGALVLVDTTTGKETRRWQAGLHPESPLAFVPGGAAIAGLTAEGRLVFWRVADGKTVRAIDWQGKAAWLRFSPDGKRLAAGTTTEAAFFDVASEKLLAEYESNAGVGVSSDLKMVAVGDARAREIELFDSATTDVVRKLPEFDDFPRFRKGFQLTESATTALFPPRFAPSGRVLLAAGQRPLDPAIAIQSFNTLLFWDVTTGNKKVSALRGDVYRLDHLSFSADSALLALMRSDGHFCVHNAVSGKLRRVLGTAHAPMTAPPLFTHDGRTLITAVDRRVIFWEIATGDIIVRREGHPGDIRSMVLSPDGRRLATLSADRTILVWDLTRLAGPPVSGDRPLNVLWKDLAAEEAAEGRWGIEGFIAAGAQTAPFLRERVKPAAGAEAEMITRWIADLDSDDFAARQDSEAALEKLAERARPALHKALDAKPSLEARRRIENLLDKLDGPVKLSPDGVRELRAVQVLEGLGDADSRRLLEELARGAPGAHVTEEAAAALERLKR